MNFVNYRRLLYLLILIIMQESKTLKLGKYLPKPYKKRRYYNKS